MQITPVTESAFIQATMTFDAVRQEALAYRQIIEELQGKVKRLNEEKTPNSLVKGTIAELDEENIGLMEQNAQLRKTVKEKEETIASHWGSEVDSETERDEHMEVIKAAIDPDDPAMGANIILEHGRTIYLPPGTYQISGEADNVEPENKEEDS